MDMVNLSKRQQLPTGCQVCVHALSFKRKFYRLKPLLHCHSLLGSTFCFRNHLAQACSLYNLSLFLLGNDIP